MPTPPRIALTMSNPPPLWRTVLYGAWDLWRRLVQSGLRTGVEAAEHIVPGLVAALRERGR